MKTTVVCGTGLGIELPYLVVPLWLDLKCCRWMNLSTFVCACTCVCVCVRAIVWLYETRADVFVCLHLSESSAEPDTTVCWRQGYDGLWREGVSNLWRKRARWWRLLCSRPSPFLKFSALWCALRFSVEGLTLDEIGFFVTASEGARRTEWQFQHCPSVCLLIWNRY